MDIAKYIGLFLNKYQYCYLPNLGNFEVKKVSQSTDEQGETKAAYNVKFTFANGSIDDALANFIATNERISIANAANGIREFCTNTKHQIKEGHEVVIPGFGKFLERNGQPAFIAEQNVQVQTPVIPYFKQGAEPYVARQTEASISSIHETTKLKEPKSDDEIVIKPAKVNWSKVVLVFGIGIVLLGLIISAVWFLNNSKSELEESTTQETIIEQPEEATPPAVIDSNTSITDSNNAVTNNDTNTTTTTVAAPVASDGTYKIAVRQYSDKAQAVKKVNQLTSFGNKAELYEKSATEFYVIIPVSNTVDRTKGVDSLKRFFNPGGKVFIVE